MTYARSFESFKARHPSRPIDSGEDRLGRRCGDRAVEPAADFSLAGGVVAVWNRSQTRSAHGANLVLGTAAWLGVACNLLSLRQLWRDRDSPGVRSTNSAP